MSKNIEKPEQRREELRQKELDSPSSSIHGSNLSDFAGSLGWKGTGILNLLIIVGFIICVVSFR